MKMINITSIFVLLSEFFVLFAAFNSAIFSTYNLGIVGRHDVRHADLFTFAVASF